MAILVTKNEQIAAATLLPLLEAEAKERQKNRSGEEEHFSQYWHKCSEHGQFAQVIAEGEDLEHLH